VFLDTAKYEDDLVVPFFLVDVFESRLLYIGF
jgi:hypothetical protein